MLLMVISYASKAIVQAGFARIEEQDAATNIIRLQKSIDNELENLSTICGDWAPWDDTRDFMLGNPDYVKSNLTIECIVNLKLDFMIFIDKDGKIFHTSAIDLENQTFTQLPFKLFEGILSRKQLFELKEPSESKSGLIISRDSTVLIAAQPISNSQSEKPVYGTLIVGRYLNDSKLAYLGEQTHLAVKIADLQTDGDEIFLNDNAFIRKMNKDTISGFSKIYDISGDKYITLQFDMPRKIYNYGKHIIFYFLSTILAIALLTMAALLFIIKIIILKPVNKLTSNFELIEHDTNINTKLYTEREDEIGSLARSFDSMMGHLKKRMFELSEKQNTTNLLNIELVKTADKVQEANSELKNFVYVASHDLREPLRKIIAFGQILKKSLQNKLAEDDAENFHFMIEGAERMSKMIDGLLIYSKVSSQAKPFKDIDLNQIVRQLRQFELAMVIEEKNVQIDIPEPLPFVKADAVQINQLLQNLIANGIKYQKKESTPCIRITSKPAADGMVKIEITDNGIGIKPEYQSSIFTMFKRLHTRDEYEGTGIGLSVCKKIVERHNGKIGVESQFEKGSTFWFTIPAAANPAKIKV